MKHFPCVFVLCFAVSTVAAQETAPSPAPEGALESGPATALAEASPAPQSTPGTNAPRMTEEVNLAETPTAEDFEIAPPPDAPDPEQTGEMTEPLEDDEEPPARPAVTGTVEVTTADMDKTVRAAVGNLVRITLESNPSTGYNWELRDFEYGVAVFHSSDLVARQSGGNVLFGAPGDTIITLQAVKPGTQDITLVYRRQWEPPDQITATFTFRLEVEGETEPAASPPAPETAPAP